MTANRMDKMRSGSSFVRQYPKCIDLIYKYVLRANLICVLKLNAIYFEGNDY